jgi:hypothetical protein
MTLLHKPESLLRQQWLCWSPIHDAFWYLLYTHLPVTTLKHQNTNIDASLSDGWQISDANIWCNSGANTPTPSQHSP